MVSGDGEHHDAADATCDLRFGYGRMGSLRLYLDVETKKKATNENLAASSAGRTSARIFRTRGRKGHIDWGAVAEPHVR